MPEGSPSVIRAFVALDLDPSSLRRLVRSADRLRMGSGAPSATWTPAAQMHVTLKFIAALPVADAAPLGEAIRPLAEGQKGPVAPSVRFGAFPTANEARIVVAELHDESGVLARLAEKVERVGERLGLAREKRGFRPHVTLARLKRAYDARRWLRPELGDGAGECRAASITLFQSELGKAGSTYTPLAHFAFD